jgi:drug/metabolite transporter (DMT)-like permease
MKQGTATYFAWCAAVVAAAVAYVVPAFTTVPLLWYYPVARSWALESQPSGFALDWYGRTLWAILAGAIALALGMALSRRVGQPSARAYRIWAAWAGMASVLAIAVYVLQLIHRHPTPEPLPPGYLPR